MFVYQLNVSKLEKELEAIRIEIVELYSNREYAKTVALIGKYNQKSTKENVEINQILSGAQTQILLLEKINNLKTLIAENNLIDAYKQSVSVKRQFGSSSELDMIFDEIKKLRFDELEKQSLDGIDREYIDLLYNMSKNYSQDGLSEIFESRKDELFNIYGKQADKFYLAGDIEQAYNELKKINTYSTDYSLYSKYYKKIDSKYTILKTEKAKKEAEEAKKSRIANVKENMQYYTNSYGSVKIAVSEVKETNTVSTSYSTYTRGDGGKFVWVNIGAKNFGSDTEHVNPNDFTLTSEDGYTASHHEVTYNFNYFDATDLNSENYSNGWLIFHVKDSDVYTLNYNGFDSGASLKIAK